MATVTRRAGQRTNTQIKKPLAKRLSRSQRRSRGRSVAAVAAAAYLPDKDDFRG